MDERERTELVERVNAGDAEALQRLIVHYHAVLRRVAEANVEPALRAHVEPDDVLQQTYISAFKALRSPPASREEPDDPNPKRQRGADEPVANAPGSDPNPKRERGTDEPVANAPGSDPNPTRKRGTDEPVANAPGSDPNPTRERGIDAEPQRERETTTAGPFSNPGHFYKWLEQIALNQLRDVQRALRRQKRDVAREVAAHADTTASYPDLINRLAGGESTPSRAIAKEEAVAAVMSCLARLKDDQREVVRLRFLEDVPVAEIARRMGKTDPAVYTLCHRGLKSLRELMVSITHYLTHL
ncbi:MAG: sigma-70 family RNA polymerase sigma factor [Phycisphaerae bacterium]|nr:sigma-70 family RNA polymerase sigma factor [Phycisphaerae bacterium]